MSAIPTLSEIREEFTELDDGTEKLSYLIEIGKLLPPFPEAERTEANRVLGCQSNVWLVPRTVAAAPDRLYFVADSDAPMVRGLVAILLAAYSDQTAQAILDFPILETFDQMRLRTFLTPMRSNGLHSMVLRIQALASEALGGTAHTAAAVHSPTVSVMAHKPRPFAPEEVARIREDFPILQREMSPGKPLVYLDNGASTQRPRSVIQSLVDVYENCYSNVHRGGHTLAAETTERYEAAREAVRRLLNARERHEIIFTSGTTAAINLVAHSWGSANVKRGDEILLTLMEHHSNIVPWQQLAERTGCRIRFAPITDDGELALDAWQKMLSERTRLVAMTAVSNVFGTINPVKELVSRARQVGAVTLIDAAQAVPHQMSDVQDWNADFVAFSGHKMLGPSGIGVLYGCEQLLDAMPPFLGGGSMIRTVTLDGFSPATLPSKFEAGTPPIVPAIGLGAAIAYLEKIGLSRIHAHEQMLVELTHAALSSVPGLTILGPVPSNKAGIVTFTIDSLHANDVAQVLNENGVAVRAGHHCAMPLHEQLKISASTRASFYFYNTAHEVERLADGIRDAVRILGTSSKR